MVEPVVCIFPHSDNEFPTADELRNFLRDWLSNSENRGRYLARKMKWTDKNFKGRVIPGSLVLFRKKGLIVGQATVQVSIQELEPPELGETEMGIRTTYYHDIFFDPRSVKVYEVALPVDKLESWSGRRLYPGTYAILGNRREFEKAFPDC